MAKRRGRPLNCPHCHGLKTVAYIREGEERLVWDSYPCPLCEGKGAIPDREMLTAYALFKETNRYPTIEELREFRKSYATQ